MRLIDADALTMLLHDDIDGLDEEFPNDKQVKPYMCGVRMALSFIDTAPTIDTVPRWIPCEDRLPKKERATYLICTESGYMCSCRWTNDMYGLGSYEWSEWGWHIMDKPQYAKVVAWMEMKPWEGADDED